MIVLLIAVLMMHNLSPLQWATYGLFHHNNVLAHVAVGVGPRMIRLQDQPVSVLHDERFARPFAGALHRAEPRTSRPPGANNNINSTVRAGTIRGSLNTRGAAPTSHRAEVPSIGEFASWPMPSLPACRANNVGAQGATSVGSTDLESTRGASRQLSTAHGERVALRVAVNAAELESAWWEINLRSAGGAMTFHWSSVPDASGRWQQKDMGHFEYVDPGAATRRA